MRITRSVCFFALAGSCLALASSLTACTFHAGTEPAAQSAPVVIAPTPAPAPVQPIAEAPTAAQPTTNTVNLPGVAAPSAPARAPGVASNGAAIAPPATHAAAAPPAAALPTSVAAAPPAGGYVDDPAVLVNSAPPQPRGELAMPSPGAGYSWVQGHYAWRNTWVWVPGGWKAIPAGRHQWVAGQWLAQGSQWRWQPGYWA